MIGHENVTKTRSTTPRLTIAQSEIHLYKSSRTGENDKEEVRDGEVEQEGVGELAQGGGAHDRRDHQEGTDGGHLGHIC